MPQPKTHMAEMPLGDHLEELRKRLLWALLGLVPIALVCMGFGTYLLNFLVEPARAALRAAGQADSLIQTGPLETFGTYMKVSLIAAVVFGSPWVLYQVWRFVAPGLYQHERRFVYFLLPLSGLLTISGLVFLFRIILPVILAWLVKFGALVSPAPITVAPLPPGTVLPTIPLLTGDPPAPEPGQVWLNTTLMEVRVCVGLENNVPDVRAVTLHRGTGIVPQFRVSEYVSLLLTLTLAFAAAFQAPLIVLLLGWMGVVDQGLLGRYRRHAILVCAILAAFLMPGDPLSMVMLWLPLMALYELGGILLRIFPASRVAGPRGDETEGEG